MDRVTLFLVVTSIVIITVVGVFLMHEESNAKEACEAAGGKIVHFDRSGPPVCLSPDIFIKVK